MRRARDDLAIANLPLWRLLCSIFNKEAARDVDLFVASRESCAMTRAVNIKRLRSPRYRPADFRLGNLSGSFEHRHNQGIDGEVIDFSGEGVALAVDAGTALYLSGDPIPRLRIWRNGETFYDGEAVVRSIRDGNGKTI